MAAFFAILLVGFAYVWHRGDLDWVRAMSSQGGGQVRPTSMRH
jgi:NADH-quinone oxidoreductase subunit A